jgi:hypothetical protein
MSALQVLEDLEEFVLRTKYDHWRYEEEFRYFVSLRDADEGRERKLHFYSFGDTFTLAEVILGPYCDLSLDDAKRLVKDHCPNSVTTSNTTCEPVVRSRPA